jgi:hypothetical protein
MNFSTIAEVQPQSATMPEFSGTIENDDVFIGPYYAGKLGALGLHGVIELSHWVAIFLGHPVDIFWVYENPSVGKLTMISITDPDFELGEDEFVKWEYFDDILDFYGDVFEYDDVKDVWVLPEPAPLEEAAVVVHGLLPEPDDVFVTEIKEEGFTGAVKWETEDTKAIGGETYATVITLAANEGFTFAHVKSVSEIDVKYADSVEILFKTETVLMLAAEFTVFTLQHVNVPIVIEADEPDVDVAVGDLDVTLVGSDLKYTVKSAEWFSGILKLSDTYKFDFGTYRLEVVLEAADGYFFEGVTKDNVDVLGVDKADYIVAVQGTDDVELKITVTYVLVDETKPDVTINDLVILGVVAPVAGATAVTEADVKLANASKLQFEIVSFAWDKPLVDGKFDIDTVYTANITVKAKAGFTLVGVLANTFEVAGTKATHLANSGVITKVFPETSEDEYSLKVTFNKGMSGIVEFVASIGIEVEGTGEFADKLRGRVVFIDEDGIVVVRGSTTLAGIGSIPTVSPAVAAIYTVGIENAIEFGKVEFEELISSSPNVFKSPGEVIMKDNITLLKP